MPSVLDLATLHKLHRPTNQDKVYVAAVVQQDNGAYFFTVRWGRRGAKNLQPRAWAMSSLGNARRAMMSKVNEQLGDGYKPIDWNEPYYSLTDAVRGLGVIASARPAIPPVQVTPAPPIAITATVVDEVLEADVEVVPHRFKAALNRQVCDVCGATAIAQWHMPAPAPEPKPVEPVAPTTPFIPERGRRQPRAVHFDF